MTAEVLLQTALPAEAFRLLLVLGRITAALMLLPGFGDGGMPVRMRTMAGLMMALCIAPLAGPALPVPGAWGILGAVAAEAVTGAMIGMLARIIIAAVLVAGQVIGQSIGVSNIFTTGLGPDSSATLGAAIQVGCVAALFAMGGHHLALRAVADSYVLFPLGAPPGAAAAARLMTATVAQAFHLALQLSLPFLMLALLFNLALAGINRALPAVPVFMIGAPALLLVGLHLLAATLPTLISETLGAYAAVFLR